MTPRKSSDRNPRATRACARCRKRKIRCDLTYPQCDTCAAVGIECTGFNSATGKEQPRSLVSFLEEKVAQLELELASLQSQSDHTPVSTIEKSEGSECHKVREDLIGVLSLKDITDNAVSSSIGSRVWGSAPYLTSSPLPTSRLGDIRSIKSDSWSRASMSHQKRDIASIPRNVLNIMLNHYSETYLVQYPILKEAELMERCDRVCGRNGSPFDHYVVCMALSISVRLLPESRRASVDQTRRIL
ncbi:hypothetical protein BDV19DRAFT_318478 [Aspergillus venezuelensis]